MTSKSSSNISSLKRKVQLVQQVPPSLSSTSVKHVKKETSSEKLKVYIIICYTEN